MEKFITKFIYITITFLIICYNQSVYSVLFIEVQNKNVGDYLIVDSIGVSEETVVSKKAAEKIIEVFRRERAVGLQLENLIFESGSLQIILDAFIQTDGAKVFIINNCQIDSISALKIAAAFSMPRSNIMFDLGMVDLRLNNILLRNFDLGLIGIGLDDLPADYSVNTILGWLHIEYYLVKWLLYDMPMEEESYNSILNYIIRNDFSDKLKKQLTPEYIKMINEIIQVHKKLLSLIETTTVLPITEQELGSFSNEIAESAIMRSVIEREMVVVSASTMSNVGSLSSHAFNASDDTTVVSSLSSSILPARSIIQDISAPALPLTAHLRESSGIDEFQESLESNITNILTEDEVVESVIMESAYSVGGVEAQALITKKILPFIIQESLITQIMKLFKSSSCSIL